MPRGQVRKKGQTATSRDGKTGEDFVKFVVPEGKERKFKRFSGGEPEVRKWVRDMQDDGWSAIYCGRNRMGRYFEAMVVKLVDKE